MSRNNVDFEGIGARFATYKAHEDLETAVDNAKDWEDDGRGVVKGKAVTLTSDGEAGYGSAGNSLLGKILQFEFETPISDAMLSVQEAGYTEFEGVSGNLPNAGDYVVVNGSGAVMASAGATGPAKAVSVDSENNKVMVLIC